jgi:hypothetical protein
MTDATVNHRVPLSWAENTEARMRTDEVARDTIAGECRRRDAKTERLRIARMQAQEQGRQL